MKVSIQLLGRFVVQIDGREIPPTAWKRNRAAAIVKLLAISPEHRVHRERAMDAFWRGRLVQRAFADVTQSWLSSHLLLRLQALAVRSATTKDKIAEAILTGDQLLTPGACQPCSMALRTASAVALAQA